MEIYYINFYQAADGSIYRGQPLTNRGKVHLEQHYIKSGFPNDRAAFLVKVRFKAPIGAN
jgi:hypothetical protein